ncbi:hypothetical protein BT96DRAFT_986195 [Gymnopus androsaceus JB14]|uniref:F-box domain-containing protein n=1 Tax=Gymnopus androsaceus JB14 TaxID=1447944 RepID=A0A6A4IFB2_9AGAR|nr:hypothetical protein BT96DRAFT_986195 [Gymnopus androsaceus JB14]
MLSRLPPELVLLTLSFLDLSRFKTLSLVCKSWKDFIDENESSIYHSLAVYRGYIPSVTLDLTQLSLLYSPKFLHAVTSWKSFCQTHVHVDRAWAGKASSRYISYSSSGFAVHRHKVDEKAGIIITSFRHGGLVVTDLLENEILWSLPDNYVKRYAHLEYGEGYLIFDRIGGKKEVWRLASQFSSETSAPEATPDQIAASQKASEEYSSTYPKGHFKPWAVLKMPRSTRAFRFVYPTLLVGSWDHAFLWDIPSCKLIQTITPIQQPEDPISALAVVLANSTFDAPPPRLSALDELNYVELDSRHVFICGSNALRVFSRESGRCILDIPSTRREFGSRKFSVLYESDKTQGAALVNQHTDLQTHSLRSSAGDARIIDEFVAVHVSSCGRHFVAMLRGSRVVIVRNFEDSPSTLYDRMTLLQLGTSRSRSKYLAIHNDHVAVATNNGLFTFLLSDVLSAKLDPHTGNSDLLISRAPAFGYRVYMSNCSCLQLSDTGLYINWDPAYLEYHQENEEEQTRLDALFHSAVNDRTLRYFRMPTGDSVCHN